MKNMRQLIEEINNLLEDELVDEFTEVDVEDTDIKPEEDSEEKIDEPVLSLTDELDAKVKISRALDTLKNALEEFKNATLVEFGILEDLALTNSLDTIDMALETITNCLRGKYEPELKNQEELDIENAEPEEEDFLTFEDNSEDEEQETESDNEEDEEDKDEEEESEDIDFDSEAELNLFGEEE